MMASGEIRLFTTTMRPMPVLAQSQNPPNPCPSSSVVFTAQQGAYAKLGTETPLGGIEATVNLFSYNTPTNGPPYLSHGIGLSYSVGPIQIGFNYQQVSYNGGLSFQPSPTNFNLWNLNASSEGLTVEFSPPQAGSGFTATYNLAPVCTATGK
jgi:hypothetical protein